MAKSSNGRQSSASPPLRPITAISVEGFKSIDARQEIEVRPLTILAGVNSSGKSSMMQPLLLLKQTLEAPYDPGPLLLNGPNAKFTKVEQFLCASRSDSERSHLSFGVSLADGKTCTIHIRQGGNSPLELAYIDIGSEGQYRKLYEGESDLTLNEAETWFPPDFARDMLRLKARFRVIRNRCFVDVKITTQARGLHDVNLGVGLEDFEQAITSIIHVPGLRGNPQRNYKLTAVGSRFPGTFEEYAASIIAANKTGDFLTDLGDDLNELGLAWSVEAGSVDDTQVELKVGRLPKPSRGGTHDMVGIADVGLGVSQTLPVVVALLTAQPGQLVYVEQPEIHLHPRAQHAMAKLLARAAMRGVQVVIETHSSILLLGIQSLVATGELDPGKVKLHWFQRDGKTGATAISSADLDAAGSFGNWPEDFDDVSLFAQQRYLDAAEKMLSHEP